MNNERSDYLNKLLNDYQENRFKKENVKYLLSGYPKDPKTGEQTAIDCDIDRNTPEGKELVEKLKKAGFMVIFPAQVQERFVKEMTEDQKRQYNKDLRQALIFESKPNKNWAQDTHKNFLNYINNCFLKCVKDPKVTSPVLMRRNK